MASHKMTPKQETRRQALLTGAHKEHQKGLNVYAFFKLHDRAMSQDLVQDTFIKTWAYLVKGGKISIMKAFLYHVLNNLIIDEYRKRKNKAFSLDELLEKGIDPSIADSGAILTVLSSKAALVLIKRLPEKYRKVMQMRYVEDLSLKEISEKTGLSKNTIAVQIHRGIEKMKLLHGPL